MACESSRTAARRQEAKPRGWKLGPSGPRAVTSLVETHNAPASVPFDALNCPKPPIDAGRSYGVSATIAGFGRRAPSG
jgi:hypothetical protein